MSELYEASPQKLATFDGIQREDFNAVNRIAGASGAVAVLGAQWLHMNLINTEICGGYFVDSKISESYLNQVVFSHVAFRGVSFEKLQIDKVRFVSCFFSSCSFVNLQLLQGKSDLNFQDCAFENTLVPVDSIQAACAFYGETVP
ncbi:MAG: pentapeptide repeat-containing protein, partial [Bdellovibrionales bacterium]|nr:pentapeptide repeat-containing protein [Bdellovibrionales bacterium]